MKTIILSVSLMIALFTVSASSHAKLSMKKPAESYAAVEKEEIAPSTVTFVPAAPVAMPQATPAPQPVKAPPKSPLEAGYDPVPSDQINPVIKRLRLVEEIARKHQRAYDYRMLTTRDLEAILSSLDKPQPQAAPISQDSAEEENPEEG